MKTTSTTSMKVTRFVTFVISIAIPMVVGLLSSMWAGGDLKTPYNQYAKPVLAPPDWLFGLVWPVLYLMMGIACYLIIASDAAAFVKVRALSVYAVQLVVNAIWSPVFFAGDMLWGALVVIVILDLLVIATIMSFWRIRKVAALLLVPYLAWVLFATYLNVGFAALN